MADGQAYGVQPTPNCVVVPCTTQDAARQGRMSFLDVGADAAEFRSYVDSPYVDFQREYEYPDGYKHLSACTLICIATSTFLYFGVSMFAAAISSLVVSLCCCSCMVCSATNTFYYVKNYAVELLDVQPLSRREFRHVIGSTRCSVATGIYVLCGVLMSMFLDYCDPNAATSGVFYTFGFVCVCFTSVLYIGGAWFASRHIMRTSTPIKSGFVVSMMWAGGIFSIFVAGLVNSIEIQSVWPAIWPTCNIGVDMGMLNIATSENPSGQNDSGAGCMMIRWVQWVLTAGLNEEVLKFAVLLRLRSSVEDIAKSCLLTRCLRSTAFGVPCCGWFFKLATSPMAVVLAGMASGAGFAAIENVSYVQRVQMMYQSKTPGVSEWTAGIRLLSASIHICMTGTCAVALSYEMFVAPDAWFLKYVALAAMAVLHGTFNASTGWGIGIATGCIGIFINLQFLAWWFVARFYIEPEYQRNLQQTISLEEGGCTQVELVGLSVPAAPPLAVSTDAPVPTQEETMEG